MLAKPRSIDMVGVVQFFLAAVFVVWLLVWPDTGGSFAWPIRSRFSALFIGCGFVLRTFMGYHLWREKLWFRLRWIKWGNFVFLGVLFAATFWHLDEMNWSSNILVAHIWVLAYLAEPLVLILIEPHGPESDAPVPAQFAAGPISTGLKRTLAVVYVAGIGGGALLFFNPAFANSRWPWALDPFDERIMAAWPAACAVWAASMYRCKDWAEIKMGMQTLIVFTVALFIVWLATYAQLDPARHNQLTYGITTGCFAALLSYFYWRHESARRTLQTQRA